MTLDRLRTLAAGAAAPLPSLFSLGQLESGELLIDLESVGLLTVDGDEQEVQGLVRSIALQLGSSQCIDHVELLYVGEDEIEVPGTSRIRRVESIDDALDELAAAADSLGGALAMVAEPSTFAGRLMDSGADGWIPTVLVDGRRTRSRSAGPFGGDRRRRRAGSGCRGAQLDPSRVARADRVWPAQTRAARVRDRADRAGRCGPGRGQHALRIPRGRPTRPRVRARIVRRTARRSPAPGSARTSMSRSGCSVRWRSSASSARLIVGSARSLLSTWVFIPQARRTTGS